MRLRAMKVVPALMAIAVATAACASAPARSSLPPDERPMDIAIKPPATTPGSAPRLATSNESAAPAPSADASTSSPPPAVPIACADSDLLRASPEAWRDRREGYSPHVRPGNQTALNRAAIDFAKYLNGMHNRVHPIFTAHYLTALDALPPSDPRNVKNLITRIELTLDASGALVDIGVIRSSGVPPFDAAAMQAFACAAPFGPPPSDTLSFDGRFHTHWELHRDPVFACSTQGVSPYLLTK